MIKKIPLIYLVPNFITLLAVIFGISAARFAVEGDFGLALNLILIAAILDALDGRAARLLNASSEFGAEWDSLSDFSSFGIAPAFIMFYWGLDHLGSLGWGIAVFYACCCGLRLARFNVDSGSKHDYEKFFFKGIPAPAGAILVLFPLILTKQDIVNDYIILQDQAYILSLWVIVVGFFMISSIPTLSFKNIKISKGNKRWILSIAALATGLTFHDFWLIAMLLIIAYIAHIPYAIIHYYRYKKNNA